MSNYPLTPMTMQDLEDLNQVKDERRLALQVQGCTQDMDQKDQSPANLANVGGGEMEKVPGTPYSKVGSPHSPESRSPKPSSPRTPSASRTRRLSNVPDNKVMNNDSVDTSVVNGGSTDGYEPRLMGSLSYKYVDVKSNMLHPQLEVTTRIQARQQILLLQVNLNFSL